MQIYIAYRFGKVAKEIFNGVQKAFNKKNFF